jgi:hypothetical protein
MTEKRICVLFTRSSTAEKMIFLLKFILGPSRMFGNLNFVLFIVFGPTRHLFVLEIFSGMEIIKIVVGALNSLYFLGTRNPFPDKNHQNKKGKKRINYVYSLSRSRSGNASSSQGFRGDDSLF